MIIDVHCHAWPDQIAEKALSGRSPQLPRFGDGTIGDLRSAMGRAGVDNGVVLGIADEARHVDGVNRFVARKKAEGFFGFGTVHAELTPEQNLKSLRDNGVRGVKLHSLFQGFAYDDPRMMETLEAFGSEIAVIAHVGDGGDTVTNTRATPTMLTEIVKTFPDLRLVCCHFGGYHRLDDAEEALVGLRVMLETSWPPTMAALAPERVRSIIDRHGWENIVFGSDWPMAEPQAEIEAIKRLGLSDEATEGILGKNFLRFLGEDVARDAADREEAAGV
jgi:predicted TIM-barrel fold metal-dependent hydrolase